MGVPLKRLNFLISTAASPERCPRPRAHCGGRRINISLKRRRILESPHTRFLQLVLAAQDTGVWSLPHPQGPAFPCSTHKEPTCPQIPSACMHACIGAGVLPCRPCPPSLAALTRDPLAPKSQIHAPPLSSGLQMSWKSQTGAGSSRARPGRGDPWPAQTTGATHWPGLQAPVCTRGTVSDDGLCRAPGGCCSAGGTP